LPLGLFSGLRNSELCHLRLADTIAGAGRSVFVVQGTPRQDRTVYVPQAVSDLVEDYVGDARRSSLPDGVAPDDVAQPLIFNERRRPFERTGLYRRVVRILQAAGFGQRASVQLLRHTYGYLAYKRSGGNLLFVQRQLGHAHPMVTSVYAQFVEEDYNRIADLVGPSPQSRKPRRKR
jgi:integrase/recombinase XerD